MIVYHYPNCSTCKKALAWLTQHAVEVQRTDVVKHPPTAATLRKALELTGSPLSKLFNTSGDAYRTGNYKERLKAMSSAEALQELASQGKLIKRPLLIAPTFAIIGFKEGEYQQRLL